MKGLIQKYLLQYHTVSIEGWGTMRLLNSSAVLDFANKQIQAPAVTISFMKQAINDHQFRDWLATELGIRQDEVQNQLQLFIQHFTEALQQQSVVWAGWGRFYKNGSQITFEAQDSIYVPAIVKAERVIRKGAEHPVRVGEDERTSTEMEEWLQTGDAKKKHLWWIIALLMSAAGIILAVLFAGKHNIQWKNNTNYQLLKPKEPQVLYKTP